MTPQEFFKGDIFAVNAGVELLEVREGYARTQLKITKEHLNAGGRTQGGALFTLADLALAACSNSYGKLSFSLSADITFLRASGEGDTLTATATMKYLGRTTGYFEVDITNQSDKLIASFRSSVFRMDEQVPFTV
jgi:acyl-CoA thioesterase